MFVQDKDSEKIFWLDIKLIYRPVCIITQFIVVSPLCTYDKPKKESEFLLVQTLI